MIANWNLIPVLGLIYILYLYKCFNKWKRKKNSAVIRGQLPVISLRRTSFLLHVSQMVWTLLERAEPKTTWVLLPTGTEPGTPGALGCLCNVLASRASCFCRDAKPQIRDKKTPEKGMHTKEDLNPLTSAIFIPYLHFHLFTRACHQENPQSLEIVFSSRLFSLIFVILLIM